MDSFFGIWILSFVVGFVFGAALSLIAFILFQERS